MRYWSQIGQGISNLVKSWSGVGQGLVKEESKVWSGVCQAMVESWSQKNIGQGMVTRRKTPNGQELVTNQKNGSELIKIHTSTSRVGQSLIDQSVTKVRFPHQATTDQ